MLITLRLLPFSYIKTGKKGVEIWVEKVLTRFLKHQTKLLKVLTLVSACFSQDFGRQVSKNLKSFKNLNNLDLYWQLKIWPCYWSNWYDRFKLTSQKESWASAGNFPGGRGKKNLNFLVDMKVEIWSKFQNSKFQKRYFHIFSDFLNLLWFRIFRCPPCPPWERPWERH